LRCAVQARINFPAGRNKPGSAVVLLNATEVAFQKWFKGQSLMINTTRIALGVSAAALSLGLALAPAAFAQDKMSKDDGMKKDTMMKKDDGMKKDAMSPNAMNKDGMKKDGMVKKDEMKK
jgi:pentapeptide MXKDX repeat protein